MQRLMIAAAALALTQAASASPETYNFDPAHTLPGFSVSHLGMSTVRGLFEGSTGKVVIDRAAKTGSVEVKIPTASVYTGYSKSVGAGRTRDEHLRSADFFNAAEFPEMVYKSTKFNFSGDKPDTIEGTLTLLGVTKPVTLKVDAFNCGPNPFNKKEMCGADLSGAIKRSDFGMKFGVPAIGDEIKLTIAVEAYK
jgi:polyisoprenoid-binding protein YceI